MHKRIEGICVKLAVILVNYNGKEYNEACIESVLGSRIDGRLRIVVVDNASADATHAGITGAVWGR